MALFKNDVIRVKFALMKLGFLKPYKNQSVDEWDTEAKEAYRAFQVSEGVYPRQAADAPHSMNGLQAKLLAVLESAKEEFKKLLSDLESGVKVVEVEAQAIETKVKEETTKIEGEIEAILHKGTVSQEPSTETSQPSTGKATKSDKKKIFNII